MATKPQKILVTGGAGFIGSAVIRHLIELGHAVVNVDKLSYASNHEALRTFTNQPDYAFEKVDICDRDALERVFYAHRPDLIMHLAAESHVDRSIAGPRQFLDSNVVGTFNLLTAGREYWEGLSGLAKQAFRFHHISTDEVYGSLGNEGRFTELSPYQPNSPYSASKAASDHFVRAWHETYGFPTIITNCSNNYGPHQYPEKLIPVIIGNALRGKPLPVYGQGLNVRDWIYVDDHAKGLYVALTRGKPGETYLLSGRQEAKNIDLVRLICNLLDQKAPDPNGSYERLITFVTDRLGHDYRYAIDPGKIERELGWRSEVTLDEGLSNTIDWYLDRRDWLITVRDAEEAVTASPAHS